MKILKKSLFKLFASSNSKPFSGKKTTLANADENEQSLLKQMNHMKSTQSNASENSQLSHNTNDSSISLGDIKSYITQRDNILFIASNPLFDKFRLGELLLINKKHYAQILSLESNRSTLILMNKANIQESGIESIDSIKSYEAETAKVKVSNESLKTVQSLSKKYQKRRLISEMLHSGHLLLDYINPLYVGNFVLMKGSPFLGQEEIFQSVIERFDGKTVLLTMNSKLIKANIGRDIEIISCNRDSFLSDTYFFPRYALSRCKELKNEGHKVLLLFDNATDFLISEKITISNAKLFASSNSVLANLYEECGVFDKGSLTVLVNLEQHKLNPEFERDINKEIINIESYADNIVEFFPSTKYLKKFSPQVFLSFHGLGFNYLIYSIGMNRSRFIFKQYIAEYLSSHKLHEDMTSVKIETDPWDNYQYHDSKVIFEMVLGKKKERLLTNESYSQEHNSPTYLSKVQDFIQLKFVNFLISNDLNSNLYGRGNRIIDEFYIFFNKRNEKNEKDLFVLYDKSSSTKAINESEETTKEIDMLEGEVEGLFDDFLDHLHEEGVFLAEKKDYFI